MKLKTILHPVSGQVPLHGGSNSDMRHDAAYAHALVMAMKQMLGPHDTSVVIQRTTTIMREWGYS